MLMLKEQCEWSEGLCKGMARIKGEGEEKEMNSVEVIV